MPQTLEEFVRGTPFADEVEALKAEIERLQPTRPRFVQVAVAANLVDGMREEIFLAVDDRGDVYQLEDGIRWGRLPRHPEVR